MSFSLEVKNELLGLKIKKYCCRKAFLMGLLSDCTVKENGENTAVQYSTVSIENCELTEKMIKNVFHKEVRINKQMKMGAPFYTLTFDASDIKDVFLSLDKSEDEIFAQGACPSCKKNFMRGVFVSLATVSDANVEYHLEFRFKNAFRAKRVYSILCENGLEPKIINRKNGIGLYYKNSTAIEDVLTYLGAVSTIFDFINAKIEKDIRNSVNRSTNCVAGNISKSVDAAAKQISAIKELKKSGKLGLLPDELFETANLRLENESASLAELARIHVPAISKSGLNHRLAKIIAFAKEQNK